MISPELRDKMLRRCPELLAEVAEATGYLDAKNLPADVDDRIDVIGEALTEITEMLRDAVVGSGTPTTSAPSGLADPTD